ncbi:hypothetical protein PHPALM_30247, partial [Phytophthora palmivora]
MAGRRPLYGDKVEHVCWKDHYWIDVGQTAEIRLRGQMSNQYKLWVTRGDRWVPTIPVGPGRTRYLQVTNISDRALTLHEGSRVAMWLSGDRIPRIPGYVSVGSRRYAEWQNLAYQATTDEISEAGTNEQITEPMVERPEYVTPTAILPRPVKAIQNVKIAGNGDANPPSIECTSDQVKIDPANRNNLRTKVAADIGDPTMDDEEEIERLVQIIWKRKHLLIGKGNALPPAAKGVVCDIDVGNAKPVAQRCRKVAIPFREKLYQLIKGLLSARMIRYSTSPWASPIVVIIKKNGIDIIWKRKHLLIGKGNALPPAAKGVVCDIDVGNAKPVAQRCRK